MAPHRQLGRFERLENRSLFSISDLLLLYPGVEGETPERAPQRIEIETFSFGVSNSVGSGQNTGAGKITVLDFQLTGKSSVAPPDPPTNFKLDFTKSSAGDKPKEYLTFELKNVFVSSYHFGGGSDLPTENIQFNFAMIAIGDPLNSHDTSGNEQVFIRAAKDQDINVENDEAHWVGHDRTEHVNSEETLTISGHRSESVDKDETITIHGSRDESVSSDETLTIHGGRSETVNDPGHAIPIAAGDEITISTGAAIITMKRDGTITIPGKDICIQASGAFITTDGGATVSPLMQEDGVFYLFSSQPQIISATIAPVHEGEPATLQGAIADENPFVPLTVTVDWGDGSTPQSISLPPGATAISPTHLYTHDGQFTVRLSVADDGSVVTSNLQANVQPVDNSDSATPHQRYVEAVYQDLLNREPDAAGLAYWSQLLDNGAAISSVAEAIAHSDEYYANFVIRPAYLKLLGRAADGTDVTYWTARMDTGATVQQLEADLVSSAEFYNNAGGTNTAWIDAVYKSLLGRMADSSGENFWNSRISAGQSLNQVALGIAGSQENNSQLINDDYFHYLGRAADSGGLAFWLGQFADGKTNEDVIAGFTGSAEYYKQHTS